MGKGCKVISRVTGVDEGRIRARLDPNEISEERTTSGKTREGIFYRYGGE